MTKPAERRALTVLADCGSGATGPALEALGVAKATLERLVARGLVTARLRTFANPPGLTVTHYWLRPTTSSAPATASAPARSGRRR